MSTSDAEDASPSPEYSGDPDGSDMAVDQKDEKPASNGSPSQQTAKTSNSKDPLRPRRKKARRACWACQRAHLTCGDERPCHRCVKRGLHESCQDGVRKKAKYLHDAPDSALIPGVAGHYHPMNGSLSNGLPAQDTAVSLAQQGSFYTQAPSSTYYTPNAPQVQALQPVQDASSAVFNPQTPISPTYGQTNQPPLPGPPSTVAQTVPPQMPQFGGALFDPSDPALFNFDISGLNFGNHYGALEMGMLGHMSAGAAETPPSDSNLMNPMNQAATMYNPQISGPFSDGPSIPANISFASDGLPGADWQNAHSRHASVQMQTPNNTPATAAENASHRNDSLSGPHAYAIGHGPSSLSSASPGSTEANAGYDNENPMSSAAFFANPNRPHQPPPASHPQHDPRGTTGALQPVQSNVVRKRRRDTRRIYEDIKTPYDYIGGYHRLMNLVETRYSFDAEAKIRKSISKFRPVLITTASTLDTRDLVHSEQSLQRLVMDYEEHVFSLVATPSLVCRRTGEVVGVSKEFSMLTNWKREILLGQEPNKNVNTGPPRDPSSDSGMSTRTNMTPTIAGQKDDGSPRPVSLIELLDEKSATQFLEDFSDLAWTNSMGVKRQRVNVLKYRTKEDVAKFEEYKATVIANGKPMKRESLIKAEGDHGDPGLAQLGVKDGLVDCMISWNMKRDNFDMPSLACIQVLPVLGHGQSS
ncbi:hypothetical protein EJ04DRAFT_183139 [Polyplosphaeria fusca]|uniref:Zn(2)-C6 fungal-type domain-containing protein n=1 Tax=Polyplosphaeria fusca TaxID=682080 RepID=A0A9P4R2N6_9PLEO|nr:hypothetical protein EJ04DRAFT_183139 [Polyplosphaeria fusca]